MSIIQINLKDEEPAPEQSAQMELYAPAAVYTEDDDLHSVPVLLIQLQDELTRSRKREALWLSVITHMLVIAALLFGPKVFPARPVVLVSPRDLINQNDLTYLQAPPDTQRARPRRSDIISDKDRVAMSRHPERLPRDLQKPLDSTRPGAPAPPGPPAQQMAQAAPPPQQPAGQPQQQQQANGGGVQAPPQQNPTLQAMQRPPANVFGNVGRGSAGSMIDQAARAAAANRGGGGSSGDFGLGQPGGGAVYGNMEVLSDTMGVDFGPYLSRVLHDVKQNWYALIPEIARPPLMKKGQLAIEFAITKDGHVAGMRLVMESGDTSLDRAAWGGISASNPFPPLPNEFKGQYLALRFHFLYNPDRNDLR